MSAKQLIYQGKLEIICKICQMYNLVKKIWILSQFKIRALYQISSQLADKQQCLHLPFHLDERWEKHNRYMSLKVNKKDNILNALMTT